MSSEIQPLKSKRELIEWRYEKEIEYESKGASNADIARLLQLDKSTISKDFKYLRRRAKTALISKQHSRTRHVVWYRATAAGPERRLCGGQRIPAARTIVRLVPGPWRVRKYCLV